ncbi:MAG: hypothetical protein IT219_06905 [Bacteroidales bacterium]|nr:hypothetical protein [Bacteroidales bacterium]
MQLKFLLDYTDSPLWANDPVAEKTFGYHVADLEGLGLRPETVALLNAVTRLYQNRLNPVYQGFPSFWSGQMFVAFQHLVKQAYEQVVQELGDRFEVKNGELALTTETIHVEKIDADLQAFLADPALFAREHGVVFGSVEELKREVAAAYRLWSLRAPYGMTI